MVIDCKYHIDLGLNGDRCRIGKAGRLVKLGENKLSTGEISIVTSKDCDSCVKYPMTYNAKNDDNNDLDIKPMHKLDRKL